MLLWAHGVWPAPKEPSHPLPRHRLLVAPLIFKICWWLIFAMHFFNGVVALVFSAIYLFFSLPAVYPSTTILKLPLSLLRISGWWYVALSLAHWVALQRMVRRSLRKKYLTFTEPNAPLSLSPPTCLARISATVSRWQRQFWAPYNRVFGVDGIFGVNGAYFDAGFFVREFIEIGLQTYQASQLSGAVGRRWITHLAVLTIVLNSLSGVFVQFVMRKNSETSRRFTGLLVDACLDFCCAAVIPLCVFYPYLAAYDLSIASYPIEFISDDTWFAASVAEIRQFCVTSVSDLFATMLPHLTVFTCLNMAKKLVQRDHRGTVGKHPSLIQEKAPTFKSFFVAVVAASRVSSQTNGKVSSFVASMVGPARVAIQTSRCHHSMHFVGHILMGAWAIAVVFVHSQSGAHVLSSAVPGCRASLNAWFATRAPCAVMQINCYRDQLQGSTTEIADLISPLDRVILKKLIITHCPALEIPPLLLEFNDLTDFDLYNSTLTAWPIEAAATPTALASLANFNWFASPYVGFPAGLLHSNLPSGFARVVIIKSNLTELPDDLGLRWASHSLDTFSVQFTPIRRLPHSFQQLRTRKFRLIGCRSFTAIHDDALATQQLHLLDFSGSAFTAFPSTVGDVSKLVDVHAEYTNIQNVSPQLTAWWATRPQFGLTRFTLSLYGSPLCGVDGEPQEAICGKDHGNVQGTTRWDLVEKQRPLLE